MGRRSAPPEQNRSLRPAPRLTWMICADAAGPAARSSASTGDPKAGDALALVDLHYRVATNATPRTGTHKSVEKDDFE